MKGGHESVISLNDLLSAEKPENSENDFENAEKNAGGTAVLMCCGGGGGFGGWDPTVVIGGMEDKSRKLWP